MTTLTLIFKTNLTFKNYKKKKTPCITVSLNYQKFLNYEADGQTDRRKRQLKKLFRINANFAYNQLLLKKHLLL